MRSLFTSLAAAGLVGMMVGCHHTAGMCDCDMPDGPCTYCGPHATVVAPTPPPLPPIKAITPEKPPEKLSAPLEKAKELEE